MVPQQNNPSHSIVAGTVLETWSQLAVLEVGCAAKLPTSAISPVFLRSCETSRRGSLKNERTVSAPYTD